jgi:GT2 family glycosyltransferase
VSRHIASVPKSLSLIILAWPPGQGRERNVLTLLEDLEVAGPEEIEVVVVQNGADEPLGRSLRASRRVDRLIALPENIGVAPGWNLGASHAQGEVLMFLNEDLELTTGWEKPAIDLLERRPDVGLVGMGDPGYWRLRFVTFRHRPPGDLICVSGSSFAIRSSAWRSIGGVDPGLAPAYYEELDLAARLESAGVGVAVAPSPEIAHRHGVSATPHTEIKWTGGVITGKDAARRNHRLMVERWGRHPWLARRPLHGILYQGILLSVRARSALGEMRARLLRPSVQNPGR